MFIVPDNDKKSIIDKSKEAVSGNFSAVSYHKYEKLCHGNKHSRILKFVVIIVTAVVFISSGILLAFAFRDQIFNKTTDKTGQSLNLPLIDDYNVKSYIMSSFVGEDINEKTAEKFKIPVGVKVIAIKSDSQISEAGLRVNDIITKINDYTVTSVEHISELENELDSEFEESIVFKVYRNGVYQYIEINR